MAKSKKNKKTKKESTQEVEEDDSNTEKSEVKKEKVVKNFAVVYSGVLGKKATTPEEAKITAKQYIKEGKCKYADVVQFIERIE